MSWVCARVFGGHCADRAHCIFKYARFLQICNTSFSYSLFRLVYVAVEIHIRRRKEHTLLDSQKGERVTRREREQ